MTRVLVTGATGFVGRTLCERLARAGYRVRAAVRRDSELPLGAEAKVAVGDITSDTIWDEALADMDCVVHLAARTHVLRAHPQDSKLYGETNADATRTLAQAAARAGLRRFVFLSSVKVNGEATLHDAFTATDVPHPQDTYGQSKWLAEQYLLKAAAGTQLSPVIVRPPLVYGPGVKANFLRLLQWVDRGWPLPLGATQNARSLISVWNLCDFLLLALVNPLAADRVWMVSDGADISTTELIRRIAHAMKRRVRLLPVPAPVLRVLGALVGRRAEIDRLCGSLRVDITPARHELKWSPPTKLDEALERTTRWYLASLGRPESATAMSA